MNDVLNLVQALRDLPALTAEDVGPALERQGWEPVRRVPPPPVPRAWSRDGLRLGIQDRLPRPRIEITLWLRDYDEQAAADAEDFDYVEGLWAEAETAGRALAEQVAASGHTTSLTGTELDEQEAEEFCWHTAWTSAPRRLILGAKQDDTDLPVQVVAIIN
ncbi:hypothetical protein [Streptomyces sp. NPDC127098]|uniref:hypothetical protein n=1 Tax=Streptomyces sp. NPDC127098 TaxID=3347137 RepID=UPI0036485961